MYSVARVFGTVRPGAIRYNRRSLEDSVPQTLDQLCVLIPAFVPGAALADIVRALLESPFLAVVVVNDGSPEECRPVFHALEAMPRVRVLEHGQNQGKGAALKTGLDYITRAFPECAGVVTADADGQHHPEDIVRVAEHLASHPRELALGARSFAAGTPLRSRVGNQLSRLAVGLLIGRWLQDTQTGLRGIPRTLFAKLLAIPASGYEFELEMLTAARHASCAFAEVPIRTIYIEDNLSSHFNPLTDSMRIYFVLMRFSFVSVLTAVLDNLTFLALYSAGGRLLASQAGGRLVGMLFQYWAARRAVFLTDERHRRTLPKYVLLVAASGTASYLLIRLLHDSAGVPVLAAKVLAETGLFFVNFAVSRDFVFIRRKTKPALQPLLAEAADEQAALARLPQP